MIDDAGVTRHVWESLHHATVLQDHLQKHRQGAGAQNQKSNSEHIASILEPFCRDYALTNETFNQAFDYFELVLCLLWRIDGYFPVSGRFLTRYGILAAKRGFEELVAGFGGNGRLVALTGREGMEIDSVLKTLAQSSGF